ncbi:MAG: VOC family protein [Acidimicrobiia bacterium]
MKVHHTAVITRDIEAATRFYRDGLGMQITLDIRPEGNFTTLFGAPEDRLHSIFLADPADPSAGTLELVEFDGVDQPPPPAGEGLRTGFFLVSFYVDYDVVVPRLAALGHPVEREISVPGRRGAQVRMGVLHDPDGVLVELIDTPKG